MSVFPLPGYGITEQIYLDTKTVNLPGIVKPYSLVNYHNGYALVMEDLDGISLKEWEPGTWKKESPNRLWTITDFLSQFLQIAIQITSILADLHHHRVIHKGIKPANILINPITLEIKLIDFSIASLLPREIQLLTKPNFLEGTLAYISPEQTGRMNRGMDYRTDFYSLGVTFFELLTGQLPFTTNDSMELVYCHIAKQPPNASSINANIPTVVSDIISKLMAKNAEDRYQSALGLKHDLEVCKKQWQEMRKIAPLELGKQDFPDWFLIPEKLYGRKSEVETLLAAFDRISQGTTEMLLVVGASGIGKTAVVNEVHKPIARTSSYFIKGKFDQFQRDIPLSGFVQAFGDLIGQLLTQTDDRVQQWKAKILSALGEQAQVIVDLIPKLELIIGKQPLVVELSGYATQNRFNLLFQRFVHVFATKEHPLVIFLDDLQWADTASLKLIELLMNESDVVKELDTQSSIPQEGGFLLIGAYRDNEVSSSHLLYSTLTEIKKTRAMNTITLEALNQGDLNCLIADSLRCPESVAVPLTQMVFSHTKGNPFFTHQFLKYLHDKKIILLNFDVGQWQCDMTKISGLELTDDVVEFMGIQLQKLPKYTQEVLKLAACTGNKFELKSLAIVHQKSEVNTAADLLTALVEGLVLPEFEIYELFQNGNDSWKISNATLPQVPKYKFVHDRIQQAAYSLIPESEKQSIHLKIGQLMLSNTPVEEREENIFEIVNQFNIALELITNQTQRGELAKMNLIAARRAKASTAYAAAVKYCTKGIQLLAADSWETNYDFTLSLYETAAETAYLSGDFEQTEQFIQLVLAQAHTPLEKVKVYEVKIQAYGARNKALEAINTALPFLKLLGVEFPENPSQLDVQREIEKTTASLSHIRIEDLIHLPLMTEALPLAVMRILSSVIVFAYQVIPELLSLIVLKQINLSVEYGNAPLSAFAYVVYGAILCGFVGDIESTYQFGKLAESLLPRFQTQEVAVKVLETFNQLVRPWKEHIKETLKPLREVYSGGLQTGDLEFAAYAIYTCSYTAYFVGQELPRLEREIGTNSNAIKQIKQERVFYWNEIYRQTVLNLLGGVDDPCRLIGEAYDEEKTLQHHFQGNDAIGLLNLYFCKMNLCYLFADYPQALENAAQAEKYLHGVKAKITTAQFHLYDSLVRLALYCDVEESEKEQILQKVTANQEKMQIWAHHAPMNYLHKYYLVEAERYRVLGQYPEAMDDYDRAITLAKEHGYINEEALANEMAAKFYLEWGKQKIAQMYLMDAYYGYVRWGASAKLDDLAKRYSQLLSTILQQETLSLHKSEKSTYSNGTILLNLSNRHTVIGSNTSISDSVDLACIIKASVALSGEIELQKLLSTLMEVVIENAGASKCALILSEGDQLNLTIRAVSSNSISGTISTELSSISLESSTSVPITLINYVKRTKEILAIDDGAAVALIASDEYIILHQPKSLLCIPIINQSKLIGILYLENNLTTGVFTPERLEVLKLLTTQAAICLQNAMLYNSLEERVRQRTRELNEKKESLQQALQDLQSTQTQLIQSEKMSSLGQMVAGIAHEINNPINFIHGNIIHARQYVQDLLDLMAVYELQYPNPSPLVQEKIKDIELGFLIEDLPKLLESMDVGSSRIQNIILGLRNFSRLDEAEIKSVDIHEGIDNTLMILQHRIQANGHRPEIEVIKEYGQVPEVTCYASQLNQVFMNILNNAIDALDEGVGNNQAPSPQIRIRTELADDHTLRIGIADNGYGMTVQVQEKIFDPFFTTKPVGSGTGLGLSISYQIIVHKHKGQLICNSVLAQGTEFVIEIPMQQF